MKNLVVIFLNVLFLVVVAADVVAMNYGLNTQPSLQTNCYIGYHA